MTEKEFTIMGCILEKYVSNYEVRECYTALLETIENQYDILLREHNERAEKEKDKQK